MIHHYIMTYREGGKRYAVSGIQLIIFRRCFCLSQRKIEILPDYQRIVVESDTEDPETIATITADEVIVADGFRVRLKPTYD